MASADDASTDIEKVVKAFASDISDSATKLLEASADKKAKAKSKDDKKGSKKDDGKPPTIEFILNSNPATKSRTPAEQAEEIVAGKSWVCWGAHMADKARHVIMKVDGKVNWDPKKVFDDDFPDFKKLWTSAMKSNGLVNANGGDGWHDGDSFHLELPGSKIAKADERAKACFEEYVRLTREEGKDKNDKFESDYAKDLKPYIDAAEKKVGDKKK